MTSSAGKHQTQASGLYMLNTIMMSAEKDSLKNPDPKGIKYL